MVDRFLRTVSAVLVTAGCACLAWVCWQLGDAWFYQRQHAQALDQARANPSSIAADSSGAAFSPPDSLRPMRIEIPRIGVAAMIVFDTGGAALRRGVAHITGTATFGQAGNVGLAAHRDTYFRNLRDISVGDTIQIASAGGSYRYVVDWTRIVQPEEVDVLDPTPDPALTLVTCFPFNYVGPAPKRFVVRAKSIRRE
jgi:sortase A